MAEIEEMKIEKTEAEEMRIDNRVQLTKVYVGGGDNFIVVSGNDISIFDRFIAAGDRIVSFAEEMDKKIKESEGKDGDLPDIENAIKIRKAFSENAEKEMDGVFGEGTTRKFFADVYSEIPDFVPDVECFLDFWDSLIPVIERLSEHKIKLEKLASKQRMAKYQTRNYDKFGGRK